jgi:hypothetical protein
MHISNVDLVSEIDTAKIAYVDDNGHHCREGTQYLSVSEFDLIHLHRVVYPAVL